MVSSFAKLGRFVNRNNNYFWAAEVDEDKDEEEVDGNEDKFVPFSGPDLDVPFSGLKLEGRDEPVPFSWLGAVGIGGLLGLTFSVDSGKFSSELHLASIFQKVL